MSDPLQLTPYLTLPKRKQSDVRRMRRCNYCQQMIVGTPYKVGQFEFCDAGCAHEHQFARAE